MVSTQAQDDRQAVFSALERQYDEVMTRRATLDSQGSSLLTFAGVIQTIMVAPLVAVATNPQARALLQSNPYDSVLDVLFGAGFALFLLTVLLGILAFRETKWIAAPQVLSGEDAAKWREDLEGYNNGDNPKKVEFAMLELQLITAIRECQSTNNSKYDRLTYGFTTLIIGLTLSAIAGYLLLLGSI